MNLGEKQKLFPLLVNKLIAYAYSQGYSLTYGETWRSPETAALYAKQGKGIAKSLHSLRIAVDFNLFQGETYLTQSEDYEALGKYWEGLSEEGLVCCWGGRFKGSKGNPKPDGNHFSIEHEGRK